jgi:hypothetical protein
MLGSDGHDEGSRPRTPLGPHAGKGPGEHHTTGVRLVKPTIPYDGRGDY